MVFFASTARKGWVGGWRRDLLIGTGKRMQRRCCCVVFMLHAQFIGLWYPPLCECYHTISAVLTGMRVVLHVISQLVVNLPSRPLAQQGWGVVMCLWGINI